MKIEITHIAITGFKGYKDKVEYGLGYRTLVTGNNALGKSTIGEAIVWALTGCDIYGNEKAATRLVNNSKPKVTEVAIDFLLDEEPQTIIRRKKGSANDVYWNEKKSSTNDIARDIFKNKNVFLSIVNPYFFPDLAPKDAKQLLSDVLKPIGRDEIFAELGDYLVKILNDNGFRIPETFMADTRADIKEHEDNIIYLEGVQDGLKPMEVADKKIFDDTELKNFEAELKDLETPPDVSEELSKLVPPKDITSELNKITPVNRQAELSELRVQEATLKASLSNLSLQELLPVEAKQERRKELLNEYHAKLNQLNSMDHDIIKCGRCGNEIDLTAQSREMLAADINEILDKGKKLKSEIDEINAKNIEIVKNNEKIKKAAEDEVNAQLKAIQIKREQILQESEDAEKEYEVKAAALKAKYAEEMNAYENKKAEILKKRDYIDPESIERINYLKASISNLKEEQKQILDFNASVDAAAKHNADMEQNRKDNEEAIQNSKNKVEQLKLALDAAKQYNSIKLKKQSAQISQYLDKVDIKFEKLTKDGELKDDFKINYEGKEFNKLSNAEKIKAGLEIANLLINLQNLHFPIFVDNAESINEVPELDTQMIQARVTTDPTVKVEVIK